MKKCTLCGKEVQDSFEGVCPECGGEIITEEKKEAPAKSADKKKLVGIIAVIAVLVCALAAGTFIFSNNDNDAPVSQEESTDKNEDEKEKADNPSSEHTDIANDSAAAPDEAAAPAETDAESSPSESGSAITLPEEFKAEDLESIIDEFNNTTDEKRKEELRLILEAIFSQAEELTVE